MLLYYVYMYRDEHGVPRYVGAGTGARWRSFLGCSTFKTARYVEPHVHPGVREMIRRAVRTKTPVECEIIEYFESAAEALALERKLVDEYGREDLGTGTLYNRRDGGIGHLGPRTYVKPDPIVILKTPSKKDPERMITPETDLRIQRLSDAIANVLVALVEIAHAGAPDAGAPDAGAPAPAEVIDEGDKPVARRGRPPKASAQTADAGPDLSASATDASTSSREATSSPKAQEQASHAGAAEDEPTDTLETAKALVVQLVQTKGRPAAVELLERYEAVGDDGKPNAKNLKADVVAAFCGEARGLIAA